MGKVNVAYFPLYTVTLRCQAFNAEYLERARAVFLTIRQHQKNSFMKATYRELAIAVGCVVMVGSLIYSVAAEKFPKVEQGVRVVSHIEDQVVWTNGVACFIVGAEPDDHEAQLQYQWQKNGSNIVNSVRIDGATNSALVISNVQRSDVGFYTCLVNKIRDNKAGKPVTVYGKNPDAPDPDKAPARLFVVQGTNTVVSGPYAPGNSSSVCIGGNYIGKTTFPVKGVSPTTFWHSRPGAETKVKIDDVTPGGTNFVAKVEILQSYVTVRKCATDNVQYDSVKAPPRYKYQFTTYIVSGSAPNILDLDITWMP
jgi:hypothetical protein